MSIRRSSRGAKADQTHFVSLKPPKKCPICKTCKPIQDEDVLDTWFSSALWPFAALGWPLPSLKKGASLALRERVKKSHDLKTYYPTQVLSTDRGIINLWVGRMIFSSYEFLGVKPFNDVYIHATVLTREGKRMSKSLGTGLDPLELIEKYGADATRFGLIWQAMGGQDIRFAEEHFIAGKKFCNKMWNASRFILMNKPPRIGRGYLHGSTRKKLPKIDQDFLKKLEQVAVTTNKDLETFRFGQALHRLYGFFWHTFCDTYLERSKERILRTKSQEERDRIMANPLYGLTTLLRLLHPFLPFITEEIHQRLSAEQKSLLIIEEWPHILSHPAPRTR